MTAAVSRQEATMQANLLRLYDRLPEGEARLAWRTVANPLATADTLLILADALRTAPERTELADQVAALAPTRALPAPKEPT